MQVFSGIGAHGYRWYLLWQMFIVDESATSRSRTLPDADTAY